MDGTDLKLMAHLLRRAGFGATRTELESYSAAGYEATVEELLHPTNQRALSEDVIRRYQVGPVGVAPHRQCSDLLAL